MEPPRLTEEQANDLVESLAEALESLVDRTCLDMAPLWLEATLQARLPLGSHGWDTFHPSDRYLRLGKGGRSKYRGLAAWRHAVLWRGCLERLTDWRSALEATYFTPYPDNAPPYAWSQRATGIPGFASPTTLKEQAKNGAWETVQHLLDEQATPPADARAELVADLLRVATRESLRDTLKLEEHEPWKRP